MLQAEEFRLQLPLNVQESYCKCGKPTLECYSKLGWVSPSNSPYNSTEERVRRNVPLGMFCTNCKLPSRYTLHYVVRSCEDCGTYYVPEPAVWTYPIKSFLCPKHHIPSRREIMLRKKLESEV